MANPPPPHPDDVYVPLGECPGCRFRLFLDGPDGTDLRVREHSIQDERQRAQYAAQRAKQGLRVYEFPTCVGSKKRPVVGSVSFPLFWWPKV